MEELYINGILIELPLRSVSRTLQVNDIGDPKDRQANYSNNIKIPRTPNNVATMEMLGIVGATTRLPYETVDVRYVLDGIELVQGGKGIVKNTNTHYNLVIYDGNIDMADLLTNKDLSSLDWSAHNHTLTESLFISSFSNVSGYIYGLAKYFDGDVSSVFSIDITSPSFYIHTLFSMIFNQEGWTVSGSIFSDSDFKSRVVTMNNGYDRILTESLVQKYSRDNSGDALIDDSGLNEFDQTYIIDTYVAVTTISHLVNYIGSVDITFGTNLRFVLLVNDVIKKTISVDDPTSFDIDQSIALESGDTLKLALVIAGEGDLGSIKVRFQTNYITTVSENSISINIDFSLLAGEMTRIDFVKDIMQRFGLIYRKVRNKLEFEFIKIADILNDRSGAEDWTNKYSNFLNESYKPNYAQTNTAKYKYDDNDTRTEQTFADGEMLIDNVNLDTDKTLFTSAFKASELVNSQYYGVKSWVLDSGVIVQNDDGMRLFRVNSISDTIRYKFKLDSAGSITFTGTVPNLQFLSYQFELDNNYLEFESMIDDYKFTKLNLYLSVIDIYQLDFFRLKYFEQLGNYYYLNKVSNFKNKKVTKVELIKIGEDIIGGLSMNGSYSGSSVYAGTLTKLLSGFMTGTYAGSSVYAGTLKLVSITAFDMATDGELNSGASCTATIDVERYHDGVLSLPQLNDTVYTDAPGTIPFVGGNLYYKTSATTNVKINNSGLVTQEGTCI